MMGVETVYFGLKTYECIMMHGLRIKAVKFVLLEVEISHKHTDNSSSPALNSSLDYPKKYNDRNLDCQDLLAVMAINTEGYSCL